MYTSNIAKLKEISNVIKQVLEGSPETLFLT